MKPYLQVNSSQLHSPFKSVTDYSARYRTSMRNYRVAKKVIKVAITALIVYLACELIMAWL